MVEQHLLQSGVISSILLQYREEKWGGVTEFCYAHLHFLQFFSTTSSPAWPCLQSAQHALYGEAGAMANSARSAQSA